MEKLRTFIISDKIYDIKQMASIILKYGKGTIYCNDVCYDLCRSLFEDVVLLEEGCSYPIPSMCFLWWDGEKDSHILGYKDAFPAVVMNYTSGQYQYNDILVYMKKSSK